MEKEFLERCLDEGMSLDEIGMLTGKHPSTVSHHLKRHGLKAVGHDRHAPSGKVDTERLRELVDGGASLHTAAAELGVSYTTIRYWVKKLGLETRRMARRRKSKEIKDSGSEGAWLECPKHGEVWFFVRPDGGFRCSKCRSNDVSNWRRRVKLRLVERAGGVCAICGYDRYVGALQFHHLDADSKRFDLSRQGVTRSYAEAEAEADKCVLLCGNCHAELEDGLTELPIELLSIKLLAAEDRG